MGFPDKTVHRTVLSPFLHFLPDFFVFIKKAGASRRAELLPFGKSFNRRRSVRRGPRKVARLFGERRSDGAREQTIRAGLSRAPRSLRRREHASRRPVQGRHELRAVSDDESAGKVISHRIYYKPSLNQSCMLIGISQQHYPSEILLLSLQNIEVSA